MKIRIYLAVKGLTRLVVYLFTVLWLTVYYADYSGNTHENTIGRYVLSLFF